MTLAKANMAFYHDAVGTRAHNEVFEIKNSKVLSQLEQQGYVTRADGEQAQQAEQQKQMNQEVGQKQALTNEAVSMAQHVQNKEANAHTQKVSQARQQMPQSEQTQQNESVQAQAQAQAQQTNVEHKSTTKKANDK